MAEAMTAATPGAAPHLAARLAGAASRLPARSGAQGLLAQAVVSATSFATGAIVARTGSPNELGLYALGLGLAFLALDLQLSLLATPFMVLAPRLEPRERRLYAGSVLLHHAAYAALATGLAALGALLLPAALAPAGFHHVLWALAAVAAPLLLKDIIRQICFAELRSGRALALDATAALLQLSLLLGLALAGAASPERAFLAMGLGCAVAAAGWLRRHRAELRFDPARAVRDFRSSAALARWTFASAVLWVASMNLYPWMIAALQGTAAAGLFAACTAVAGLGNPLLAGLVNILGPRIAHAFAAGGLPALRRATLRAAATAGGAMLLFALGVALAGDLLLKAIYGASFGGHGLVVTLLALSLALRSVDVVASRALFALDRARLECLANVAALLALLALGPWLVGSHGPLGAAVALLITGCAATAMRLGAIAWALRREATP